MSTSSLFVNLSHSRLPVCDIHHILGVILLTLRQRHIFLKSSISSNQICRVLFPQSIDIDRVPGNRKTSVFFESLKGPTQGFPGASYHVG